MSKITINDILKDSCPELFEKDIYIDGLKTPYRVRSNGEILSLEYQGHKRKKPYVMKGGCDTDGYHHVILSVNGKKYTKKIHRLVAQAFIPNPENKPEVNHIDGNKWNNDMNNLEWATTKENTDHAYKLGLRDIKHEYIARKVCEYLESNKYSIKEICEFCKVEKWYVKKILKRDMWINVISEYNIDNYNPKDHNESVYTVRKPSFNKITAKEISKLIESNQFSLMEISKKFKVEKYDVLKLYHGKLYPEVSKDYDFTKYEKRQINGRKK